MISIISNNCWGADFYKENKQGYATPTVGLWFSADDYLNMLKNFRHVINYPLTISNAAKYAVGVLCDNIKVQFMHYKSEEEAVTKWSRRVSRISKSDNDIFVKICDNNGLTEKHLHEFDSIPFRKVAFLKKGCWKTKPYPWIIEVESDRDTVDNGDILWTKTKPYHKELLTCH